MADLTTFTPVRSETAESVRGRLDADVNAGVDPDTDLWLDTAPGGFWYDITQAVVLEFVRLWDVIGVEVPAAMFPKYAWDIYLDEHGEAENLPRKDESKAVGSVQFAGTNGTLVPVGVEVATVQTDPEADPVTFLTIQSGTVAAGFLSLLVEADSPGDIGNVGAGTITQLLTPVTGLTAVTNPAATNGGADVETDEEYRDRLIKHIARPLGSGNVGDYERWALEEPEIGYATVEPVWSGAGTVRVVITDRSNRPVSTAITDALKAKLDPVDGEGRGLAPVGAVVTVATVTEEVVDVEANVTYLTGYSEDGALGTIALAGPITEEIRQYVEGLAPAGDVIVAEVSAAIMSVAGVADVSGIELDNVAANKSIASLQVARLGAVDLT